MILGIIFMIIGYILMFVSGFYARQAIYYYDESQKVVDIPDFMNTCNIENNYKDCIDLLYERRKKENEIL